MSELYLLLTPVLVLAVVALVRFVGCNQVLGIVPTGLKISTPLNLDARPGADRIELSWTHPIAEAASFKVYWGFQSQPFAANKNQWIPAPPGPIGNHSLTVSELDGAPLVNGATYFFQVTAVNDKGDESDPSDEDSAVVGVTFFVTSWVLNGPTTFDGWVGMAVLVGDQPLKVTALGRIIIGTANQDLAVKMVDAVTGVDVGLVVPGRIPESATRPFAYADLVSHVQLEAGATYYFVMQVMNGGDQYYQYDATTVETTAAGNITSAVYFVGTQAVLPLNSAGHTYGPVDFKYYLTT